MRTLLVVWGLLVLFNLQAQVEVDTNFIYKNPSSELAKDTVGKVVVHQSDEIASILEKKVLVNETRPKVKGYRIQILSVSGVNSSDKANKEMAEFLMNNPDARAYIVYNAPYFKVRIGDFKTKLEAHHYLQGILKNYPFAFVVIDEVNIPYIPEEEQRDTEEEM